MREEVAAPYKVAVNESNALTIAVLAGLGVAQMVAFIAQPFLESGRMMEVLPDWTREPLSVHAVYPPNRHLSAKVRVFVDWAAQLCGSHAQTGLRSAQGARSSRGRVARNGGPCDPTCAWPPARIGRSGLSSGGCLRGRSVRRSEASLSPKLKEPS